MKDFSKNILQTIERKNIQPLPRWIFFAQQAGLVGAFLLSVLVGGISVSVILFSLSDAVETGMGRMMRMHPGPFLFTYLPYVWVLVMIAFGALAYVEARHTKAGYRYRMATIVGASFLASIVLGGLLHAAGAGRLVDRRFAEVVPQYRGLDARKMHLWMHPQEGVIAGRIVSGSATTTLTIEDFTGMRWIVETDAVVSRGTIEAVPGERIRVFGSVVAPGVFHATELFPWTKQGAMMIPERFDGRGMLMRERKMPLRS